MRIEEKKTIFNFNLLLIFFYFYWNFYRKFLTQFSLPYPIRERKIIMMLCIIFVTFYMLFCVDTVYVRAIRSLSLYNTIK